MGYKFVVVIGVAMLAALIQSRSIEESIDPFEPIDHLIYELEIEVNKILEEVNKTFTAAIVKVNETAGSAQKKAVALLKNSEQLLRNGLDELKKKAADAGVNIDDCLAGNEEKLVDLPNIFAVQLIRCVSDGIIDGVAAAQHVLNEIQQLISDIDTIRQDYEKCKREENVRCLFRIIVKIQNEEKLLTKIERDADTTEIFLAKLPLKIETCGYIKEAAVESELEKVGGTMATCIVNKIHH